MLYRTVHRTVYHYESPVVSSQHLGHLKPRSLPHQVVSNYELTTEPGTGHAVERLDYFGNSYRWFQVDQEHTVLTIVARSEIEVCQQRPSEPLPGSTGSWEECREVLSRPRAFPEAQEFRLDSPLVRRHSALCELTRSSFTQGRDLYEAVVAFNRWIRSEFRYDPTATEVSTPLPQVVAKRRGVCQDFAHVAVGCLRSLGLAARYVSGYLETTPPAGKARLVGADASHAWASVFIPALGWLDFDPTNAVLPSDRHITVAWGRDFSDVTPLKGVILGGGTHRVVVGVDVISVTDAEPGAVARSA